MIAILLALIVEVGHPPSGAVLRLRDDFGDPRSDELVRRWWWRRHG